jgi:flagellar biosynthetic protein FliP
MNIGWRDYLNFLMALLFVLGLIAIMAWGLKRLGGRHFVGTPGQRRRLSLVEVLPIDARRRLVLVRRDDRDHLNQLGMTVDLDVQSDIPVSEATGSGTDEALSNGAGNPAARPSFQALLGGLAGFLGLSVMLWPDGALAQSLSLDLGEGGGTVTARIIQLVALITVLSLAPTAIVMVTSFTRIVIVLSLLRTAMGAQQTPPNAVLISLALFLTFFIMQPTFQEASDQGIQPLIDEQITEQEAFTRTLAPLRDFMLRHVREQDLALFMNMAGIEQVETPQDTPMRALIPAFMISELRRAFEIGFLLFVPFLIIDMVVASILMAMGMMMLPPVMISLPFKLIFFVLVDGWYLVVGSLVQSFNPV